MGYYPEEYQNWLFQALNMQPGDETDPDFLEPLYYLNRQWVKTDSSDAMRYDGEDALMRAYTCYYMTINMPKLWFMLDHAAALNLPDTNELRITELGCGPGTFLWAFLFYLQKKRPHLLKKKIQLIGVDRSKTALQYAEKMAAVIKQQVQFENVEFEFIHSDWKNEITRPCDLLIFGNVLNEGQESDFDWQQVQATNVAIIEPGTNKSFQSLRHVRDRLVASGRHIQFPCPQASAPCPMDRDNWCHFSINRFQLPFIQRISNRAKRLNARHNFSGFLLTESPTTTSGDDWRILSKLRKANRTGIRWICNGCQLTEAILSRKSRSDNNRPFLSAEWGDILTIQSSSRKPDSKLDGRFKSADRITLKHL